MPATTAAYQTRPLSPRQASFIASLAAERVVPEMMGDAVRRADAGVLPSRAASELITTLMNAPRRDDAATTGRTRSSNGDPVPSPSDTTRAGRMLHAGGVEATVTLLTGEHVTLRIRSRKSTGRGWTNCAPTDEGARININANGARVGWVNVENGTWKVTLRSRSQDVRDAVVALFAYAGACATGLIVQEASRCGRCMRTLTDPVSIARGIGPECFGRGTGSRAARIEAGIPVPTGLRADAELATVDAVVEERRQRNEAARAERRQAQHDADFAAREREQERAAFASDPDYRAHVDAVDATREALETAADALTTPVDLVAHAREELSLTTLAADAASPVLTRDKQRARDLISEALDAYCSEADRDFAMRTFDQLAAR